MSRPRRPILPCLGSGLAAVQRALVWVMVLLALGCRQDGGGGVVLLTRPAQVYKAADVGNLPLESWFFHLVIQDPADRSLEPVSLELVLLRGDLELERQTLRGAAVAALKGQTFQISAQTPPNAPRRVINLAEAFDLHLLFTRPRSWQVDAVRIRLTMRTAQGRLLHASTRVAVGVYEQKSRLLFPFRGKGQVTQGPFHNRGHYGQSNQHAIDVIGLTPDYAPQVSGEERNESYAGWRRELIAPADGVVRYARGDVPSNPRPEVQLEAQHLAALPDPTLTVPGNFVVIDHGQGEHSVLMHIDTGSVTVRAGDRVRQGQLIGRLGNSGDSFGPHLHYQLQAGPTVFLSDPLPVRFDNLGGQPLVRGVYFDAR